MAHSVKEILNICRFCLNQEEEHLVALLFITDATLPIEDISLFTGIKNLDESTKRYMVCDNCHKLLLKWAAYRRSCLDNDVLFKELSVSLVDGRDSVYDETEEYICEFSDSLSETNDAKVIHEKLESIEIVIEPFEELLSLVKPDTAQFDDFGYSANKIELGEPFSSDDDQDKCERNTKRARSKKVKQNPRVQNVRASSVNETDGDCDSKKSIEPGEERRKPSDTQLCDICGKLVCRLRGHMQYHTKKIVRACPHCPVTMNDSRNLYRHIQAVHLKKIIKTCDICGKGFTCIDSHVVHMRAQHAIGKTHDCKICFKQFNNRGGLREHFIRLHSEERKFKCAVCGSLWKTRRMLRVHERVHSDDQPFGCKVCPKRFKSPYAKRTHELTHSGIVFQCKFCEKSYRYKTLLNAHVKKKHSEVETD